MGRRPTPPIKMILLVMIILIGAFLRLHQIAGLPPGADFDPAYYGLDALRILDGERPVYFATNYGREPMFGYLVAALYLVLGPGTLGIHLASALVGIFTIPAMYLVGDEFSKWSSLKTLRHWGGMLAALILALSYWHLNWSRYGVRAILIPLFFAMTAFFLLRALRKRQALDFLAAGIFLGLSFYTYQLAQLLPLLILLLLLYDVMTRHSCTKQDLRHFLLLFGAALLIWLPLAFYVYSHPGVFNQRLWGVFIFRDSSSVSEEIPVLLERGQELLLLFAFAGDSDLSINLPGRPLFNPFLSLFFFLGILVSLWRWRQPGYLFLLSWLALMVAPALLADKAALGKRALGALPAAILLISLGLTWPLDSWLARWRYVT